MSFYHGYNSHKKPCKSDHDIKKIENKLDQIIAQLQYQLQEQNQVQYQDQYQQQAQDTNQKQVDLDKDSFDKNKIGNTNINISNDTNLFFIIIILYLFGGYGEEKDKGNHGGNKVQLPSPNHLAELMSMFRELSSGKND